MRVLAIVVVTAGMALGLAACGGSSNPTSSTTTTGPTTTSASAASLTACSSQNETGFEGIPLECAPEIAPASTTQTGTVDGIHCAPVEQLAYHIHAHLAVFKNGQLYALPGGVGIPGSQVTQSSAGPVASGGQCIYWLHTHTFDGVIHIESPTKRIYTLGQFFDEWHQPLSSNQVGTLRGRITAFVNGKTWTKSVREIPLIPHAVIQFNIGEPTPPLMNVSWAGTNL